MYIMYGTAQLQVNTHALSARMSHSCTQVSNNYCRCIAPINTLVLGGTYGNFHLGIRMKKIPRYTGISQYLRYHNLHSKVQWKVHYSRTLRTIFKSLLSQKPI